MQKKFNFFSKMARLLYFLQYLLDKAKKTRYNTKRIKGISATG